MIWMFRWLLKGKVVKKNLSHMYAEIVNYRVLWIAIILCVVGFLFIFIGTPNPNASANPNKWYAVLCSLGGSLFAAGILSTLWEVLAKRAFAEEMLHRAGLAKDITAAGILQIVDSFRSDEMKWSELLQHTKCLDIFVCWAKTWRNHNKEHLQSIVANPEGRIRLVLPDPDHEPTITYLANSFEGYDIDRIKQEINEAIKFFKDLDQIAGKTVGHIEIWCVGRSPQFSWYRLDYQAVFAFYAHRGKVAVPTVVCNKEGYLYDFANKEFEFFFSGKGEARRVYPENQEC